MTWIEQRVTALEERLSQLKKRVTALDTTEISLSGNGDPNGVVTAVQGTTYWDITNQIQYVNTSTTGTPPQGTVWTPVTCLQQNCWRLNGVGGGAVALDSGVSGILTLLYAVTEVTGGGTSGGTATVVPGGSVNIYTDGVDTLAVSVSVPGAVTIQRTAGTDTFNVNLSTIWI